MIDINKEISYVSLKIDQLLEDFFLKNNCPSENLLMAMKYSTIGSGKKFRPFLIYTIAKKLGIAEDVAFYVGMAIEMLHSYTLIHDDLPSMDNDDVRRGKPSSHIKFNEFTAILAGDALQTEAFYLLSSNELKLDSAIKLQIINLVAEVMGSRNLISGQMLDLDFAKNNTPINVAIIEKIHILKTAKLISLCTVLPSIIADKDVDYQNKLALYGEKLGIIYQIVDDMEDSGSNEPMNIVNILGKAEAMQQLQELNSSSRALLKELDLEDLTPINDYITKNIL
ncbi:MAG: polyprenyl synthetase family protein [Alphaproteobacteria bacterium]|jgi:farnesyl diphosphate synthase|nr:polyprenyl synthetase family protein [Alphaproteobacteria bacterium]